MYQPAPFQPSSYQPYVCPSATNSSPLGAAVHLICSRDQPSASGTSRHSCQSAPLSAESSLSSMSAQLAAERSLPLRLIWTRDQPSAAGTSFHNWQEPLSYVDPGFMFSSSLHCLASRYLPFSFSCSRDQPPVSGSELPQLAGAIVVSRSGIEVERVAAKFGIEKTAAPGRSRLRGSRQAKRQQRHEPDEGRRKTVHAGRAVFHSG